MLQDGLLKAIQGITSVDEVKRATGEGEFLENLYERLMENKSIESQEKKI